MMQPNHLLILNRHAMDRGDDDDLKLSTSHECAMLYILLCWLARLINAMDGIANCLTTQTIEPRTLHIYNCVCHFEMFWIVLSKQIN